MENRTDLKELLKLAHLAPDSHINFAQFVEYAEVFCGENNPFLEPKNAAHYDELWFEMEIINALALSDWEDAGRPKNWSSHWDENYKHEVENIISEFLETLENDKKH